MQPNQGRFRRHVVVVACLCATAATAPAHAVRPFVTDDARIVDEGQFTSELWLEHVRVGGTGENSLHALAGVALTQWLELTAVGSAGLDTTPWRELSNPVLQAKLLLRRSEADGATGIAVSTGYIPNAGSGSARVQGDGAYALMLLTKRLRDDALLLHANLGMTGSRTAAAGDRLRPYWGFGAEFALGPDPRWRGVAEVFSGDPFDPQRSRVAAQLGLRWLKDDKFNFDLIAGWQPEVNPDLTRTGRNELWLQAGVRITLDWRVPGGRRGRAEGGDGLFRRRTD
jgi:hypothetical protein